MADIVKPTAGATGWDSAVDATIDAVNGLVEDVADLPFPPGSVDQSGAATGKVVAVADDSPLSYHLIVPPSGYTDEQAQDAVAPMFTGGTHTGIGFAYDDATGKVNATVTGGVTEATLARIGRAELSHLTVGSVDPLPLTAFPPTITQTGSSQTRPYAGELDRNTSAVRKLGGTFEDFNTKHGFVLRNNINAPGPPDGQPFAVEFMMSGTTIAVGFLNGSETSTLIRTFVDGQPAESVGRQPGAGSDGGGTYWHTLVFPTSAVRHIVIEFANSGFAGISYPTGTLVYPPEQRKPRFALYGDSWISGSDGLQNPDLLCYRIGQALGVETNRMGHGGSGYVTDHSDTSSAPMTDATRLAKLAEWAPDYALLLGSVNDDPVSDAALVGAAAQTVFSTLAQSTPSTRLIVVGPQKLPSTTPANRLANRDAIKAAALAAPNVIRWIDPIARNMVDASEGSLMFGGTSGTHLTSAGQAVFTKRLINALLGA